MAVVTRTEWNLPVKRQIRTDQLALPHKVKTVLTLPGPECLDIKQLLETSLIDTDSVGIAVEHFGTHWAKISKYLAAAGLSNWQLRPCDLEEVNLLAGWALDFANLDMCTAPSLGLYHWMRNTLTHSMEVGGQLAITLLRPHRAEPFMARICRPDFFTSTNFLSGTAKMLEPVNADVSPTCIRLAAVVRLCMPTCVLMPRYFQPYRSDSGAAMLAARFEVVAKAPVTVPRILTQRLG